MTWRLISAPFMCCSARLTPSRSTSQAVSRKPAVSTTRSGIPSTRICSSMVSRVVPGRSVTMALCAPIRRFMRVDLPTLGCPEITAIAPSRMRRPSSADSNRSASPRRMSSRLCWIPDSTTGGSSPSSKSSEDSKSAIALIKPSQILVIELVKEPSSCSRAADAARSDFARMRSATASACRRSRRPFRNARLVNSPGSAMRAPHDRTRLRIRRAETYPPCPWSSTTSSRV